jgi:hypothetical protein
MYDPYIEIFGNSYIQLWHKDPCTDGSDDSCGWSRPKLTKKEINKIESTSSFIYSSIVDIYNEWHNGNELRVIYTVYMMLKWSIYSEHLKDKDIKNILSFSLNIMDDIRIHDDETDKQGEFRRFCYIIARHIKVSKRYWFQHPRWHIHHWRINIPCLRRKINPMRGN